MGEMKAEKRALTAQKHANKAIQNAGKMQKAAKAKDAASNEKVEQPPAAAQAAAEDMSTKIAETEKAAVQQMKAEAGIKAPKKDQISALARTEEEGVAKTLALSELSANAKAKVRDAQTILEHATKINKFVSKS